MYSLVPQRIREHPSWPRVQQGVRILQSIIAIVNIGLFASYVVRTSVRLSHSSGAVVGILAAAIAFSVVATAISCTRLHNKTRVTVILWIIDILFIAAFVAVSVITALDRNRAAGPAGAGNRCARSANNNDNDNGDGDDEEDNDGNRSGCTLTSASLALAIVSTILHTLSSAMQGGKQTSRAGKLENPMR